MQKHEHQINSILEKGFSRLVLDQNDITMATEQIIRRAKEVQFQEKKSSFLQFQKTRLYAIAALILLCSIPPFIYMYLNFKRSIIIRSNPIEKHQNERIKILSLAGDPGKSTESLMTTKEMIATNTKSQLLLAAGTRARVLMFESTSIKVDRADSVKTAISLNNGLLSVNVTGSGTDTVIIKTNQALFTQIGTFFSIYTDSINGSVLHVYQGKVRVQDRFGTDLIVEKGWSWTSKDRKEISERTKHLIESDINQVFKNNKIEKRILWSQDFFLSAEHNSEKNPEKESSSLNVCNKETMAFESHGETDLISALKVQIENDEFPHAAKCIAKLKNTETIDSAFKLLIRVSQYNVSVFKYKTALNVLDLIIEGNPFRMNQREDAWIQSYFLHKEYLNSLPEKRLSLVKNYHRLFPDGNMSDDMASEEIDLQLLLKNYQQAVSGMENYIKKYPHNARNEYYSYLLATIVREQLRKEKVALDLYKQYIRNYQKGKYEEDAIYWTIQLSLLTHDQNTAEKMRKIYVEKYPNGRWSKELRRINMTSFK
ncbi:MAG: hypothetical protein GX267_06745 [Fibrobacter sp.]|jgi:hypothetical protein|nr:hypothetical protein [Fibrobacter sp.]